ncbi:MAG: head-tail adaptor protein [Gammaproteobacteria bacterium]|nr:head-tail adaptor protein [Gammaproteobacteria bacterium]
MKRKPYRPPILDLRVTIRNPSDRPETHRTRYGVPESRNTPSWGDEVMAHKSDMQAFTLYEDGMAVRVQRSRWTIRHREAVAPNCEFVHDGEIYRSTGPGCIRGGRGQGRRTRYLEFICELRQ